jgi:hypothetical protein
LVELCRERDEAPQKYLGTTIDVRRADGTMSHLLVDQARVDSATVFIDHVNSLPGVDFNEQRIHYPQFIPGAFGTLDAARAGDGVVYLRDFKDGGLIVYAADNEQLLGQALGFYLDWNHLFDITGFNLGIVQPRRDHVDIWEFAPGDWTVPLEFVLNWATTVLKPAYERAQQPNPPYTPGEHCTFCKIRGTCKAQINQTFSQLTGDFTDLDDALDGVVMASPLVGRYTNAEIAKILPMLPVMMKSLKDLKNYAFAEVAAGRAIGDFKIVAGRGERAWRQDKPVVAELVEKGVTEEQIYEPRQMRSVAALEKVVGKPLFRAPSPKKPEPGPFFDLFESKRGKPALAPGDDKREAIQLSASDSFEDLEDEE